VTVFLTMFDIQIVQHYVVKLHNGFLKNTLVQILTRVLATCGNLQSTRMQLLFSFDRDMRVEKTLMQTLASHLSFSIDPSFTT
jgi:hypothetical protein